MEFRHWLDRSKEILWQRQIGTKAKNKDESASGYEIYFNYSEKLSKIPPHRILAINRAENEGIIKVKVDIEKTIENRKLQDEILEVRVPLEDVVEMRNGVKKQVSRKMFPGYVLIHMIMNDDTWYVVRNTRGVTGFVGPGSKPVPLDESEMENLGIKQDEVILDLEIGDVVTVLSGAWEGTVGAVQTINEQKKSLTINVELFGRETPVELGFSEVKKMD